MVDLPIIEVSSPQLVGDAWASVLVISDGDDQLALRVEVSDTRCCIACLAEPTREWIVERARTCAPLLDNYHPVLEQLRMGTASAPPRLTSLAMPSSNRLSAAGSVASAMFVGEIHQSTFLGAAIGAELTTDGVARSCNERAGAYLRGRRALDHHRWQC